MKLPDGATLARAAAAYDKTLEAMPDAVVVVNADGRLLFVNQQTELLFGYARQMLLGQPIEMLLPERYRARHVSHVSTYIESPRVRPMGAGLELFGLRKDGSEVPVEISLSPSALGGELVVIGTVRNVTERVALLQQLRSMQTVTDAALAHLSLEALLPELLQRVRDVLQPDTVAILLLDEAGKFLVARAAVGIEEEVEQGIRIPVGQGFAGRIAAEKKPVMIIDIDQAELVNPILRRKGIRSLLGVPLLVEGRVIGVLHVGSLEHREFTAEETGLLQRAADRAALALDHARLYSEAENAVRIRNEFLSTISHDLGNPVAAIRMASRQLQGIATNQERNQELVDGLVQIEGSAVRMWKQIEELLDLARLQIGRELDLNWQSMDLVATVRELIAVQQATSDKHRFRLVSETAELQGDWDRTRIERVLTNVLANAVKYSPEGGEIRVWLRAEEDSKRPAGWAAIEIRDEGIGIPAADLPHIFERFHRAKNVVGRFAGTGIGLAGAQQIVNLHGGVLQVASAEDAGTTVTIRLPLGEDLS
jgi:PAS domain S-box-containing protein